MNRFTITTLVGNEFRILCCTGEATPGALPSGALKLEGQFSVETTDTAAYATITRLWMAGTPAEVIANSMTLGLLPPKAK